MGIKMKESFHTLKNRNVTIDEAVEGSIRDNLFCSTNACRIPISFRASHFRQTKDKQSLVQAHFKVKNENHVEICPFNTVGQIKIIARDSDGVLESLNKGAHLFRLNLITSTFKWEGSGQVEKVRSQGKSPNAGVTKRYESKGKLTPYLSTVSRIMKLRSEIEDNTELSSVIKLDFNNEEISWSKFYYERENYRKCFNYIKSKKPSHPVCIEGKIKGIEEVSGKSNYYRVNLVSSWVEKADKDDIIRIPSVSIYVYSKAVAEHIISEHDAGKRGIVFYSQLTAKAKPYTLAQEYLNINGVINNEQQVYLF